MYVTVSPLEYFADLKAERLSLFHKLTWERYFSKIVLVENEYLKKRWNELYALRCNIAHNNMFIVSNYKNLEFIVAELKPNIQKAIDELDSIKINDDFKESVSESFARTTNEQVGSFIIAYNKLDKEIHDVFINVLPEDGVKNECIPLPSTRLLAKLSEGGFIEEKAYKDLKMIIYKRNKIVYQDYHILDDEINPIFNLINDYISYLQDKNSETERKELGIIEIK